MTKESLMATGLTEDQATKVMEALNGSFVPKTRFNEVNTELQTAKATIKERDSQLEALQKSTGDVEALKNQITELQTANTDQQKKHDAELKKLKIDNAVDSALKDAKAINPATVRPLLTAFLEKAELADDATVKGLDDEIGKLVKGADTAFLFDTAAGTKFKGAKAAEKGDPNNGRDMTLDKLRKMTPMERYEFSVNHPDKYRELYDGGNK